MEYGARLAMPRSAKKLNFSFTQSHVLTLAAAHDL